MKAKICVSLLPKNHTEALSLINRAETLDPDLIELRLDFLGPTIDFNELAAYGNKPKIATIFSKDKETKPNITGVNQQKILLKAAKHGFNYVDVGLSSPKLKSFIKEIKHFCFVLSGLFNSVNERLVIHINRGNNLKK